MEAPLIKPARNAAEAISVEDLTFTYARMQTPALRGVTLSQIAGETIGVMGASGAGKSTLAKVLNRIIPELEGGDFRGVVRIAGRPISDAAVAELAQEVGMVFQDFEAQLFSTTVAHEVAFAMEQVGMSREEINARLGPALHAVGLHGFEHRDPTSLSGGQKQRLAIASVLALRPRVIVLDEPTTDLDPEGRAEVFTLIRRLRDQGLSLIVIEHEAVELRECDRIVILHEGELIAEGAPESVMMRLQLLEDCGIHPPDLNLLFGLLGIEMHARGIDHAEAEVRKCFPRAGAALPHSPAEAGATSEPAITREVPSTAPLLVVGEVSFAYPGGPRVLEQINLMISPGEFVAIIGQNGSGKTTLAKMIVGLLRPDSGTILVDGKNRAALHPAETARQVGYVFQNPDHQIFAASVEEEVKFGPQNFALDKSEIERRATEVLDAVGLADKRESDPFLLSKGERQRLAVAGVLALRPRLLILDEPTTGLDYREQRKMMDLIVRLNASGVAIVMITHTPWLVAEYAHRVILIRKGRKLYDGGVREFFANDALLRSSSFRPPEVTALSRRFGITALTPGELAEWLKAHR